MDTQFANTFALISGVTEWRKKNERKKNGEKQIEQKGKQLKQLWAQLFKLT